MAKFFIWLKSFFCEDGGKGSFARLVGFLSLILVLRIAWMAAVKAQGIPDNLEGLAIFQLLLSGPYLGGKASDVIKSVKGK